MQSAVGKSDSLQAFEHGDRNDDYVGRTAAARQQGRNNNNNNSNDDDYYRRRGNHHHASGESDEAAYGDAPPPPPPRSPRPGYGADRRRRPSFNDQGRPRSVSPYVAAGGGSGGGGRDIFGPGVSRVRPPRSPRPGAAVRKPSIEVTSGGGDAYLSPDQAKNPDDWQFVSVSEKRGRDAERDDEEYGRRPKRSKTDSDDDEEDMSD